MSPTYTTFIFDAIFFVLVGFYFYRQYTNQDLIVAEARNDLFYVLKDAGRTIEDEGALEEITALIETLTIYLEDVPDLVLIPEYEPVGAGADLDVGQRVVLHRVNLILFRLCQRRQPMLTRLKLKSYSDVDCIAVFNEIHQREADEVAESEELK